MNTAYINSNGETFLLVRVNEDTNDYLTMRKGIIDVETISKDEAIDTLTTSKTLSQNLVKNATTLSKSVLPKTPLAQGVINLILSSKDTLDDYVTPQEKIMTQANQAQAKQAVKKQRAKDKKPSLRKADGVFTLADLARELKLDPRDVRAKFRKANMTKPEGGWIFPNEKRNEIKALITGKSAPAKKPEPTKPVPPKGGKKEVVKAAPKKAAPKKVAPKAVEKPAAKKPAVKKVAAKKVTVNLKQAA